MKILRILALSFLMSSKIFIKIGRAIGKFSHEAFGDVIQNIGIDESTKHNMLGTESEIYYLDKYWQILGKYLGVLSAGDLIVDLGCSQGRFAHRLAVEHPKVKIKGIDLSQRAIDYARDNSPKNSENLEFQVQTIRECLSAQADNSVSVIIMTEVTFFYPDWIKDIPDIQRCLRPGGLFIITFRSRYYNLLHCIGNDNWEALPDILEKDEGFLFGNSIKYQWKDKFQVSEILEGTMGFHLDEIYGIGGCSGIDGDPFSRITMPENLNNDQKDLLGQAEEKIGRMIPDASRYMLAISSKSV
jgi:SAM-dependent methyltransferase